MLQNIQQTLVSSAARIGKMGVVSAAVMAALAPAFVQAEKLSESASAYVPASQVNAWFDDRAEVTFRAFAKLPSNSS